MFEGLEVVGQETLKLSGAFEVRRFWIRGMHPKLSVSGQIRFVEGWTGPETEVTLILIRPFGEVLVVAKITETLAA